MQCFFGVDYGNNVRKVLTEHSREWAWAGIPYLHKLSTLIFFGGGSHWVNWVYVYNESSSIVFGTKYRHQIAQFAAVTAIYFYCGEDRDSGSSDE